jgi:phage terminase large subunit-like protein
MEGIQFDKAAVQNRLDFMECLTLTKSTKSGRPELMSVLPHWKRFTANIYGWRRWDGRRCYTKGFFSSGRKQAKTQYISALGLSELVMPEEIGPEIYAAAKDREQASRCYIAARDMVLQSPELQEVIQIVDSSKELRHRHNGGVFKALSSEGKSKHGLNPTVVIFDELHAWGAPEQELYDALTTADITRKSPLQLIITTAGSSTESICYREYKYAKQLLANEIQDPTYFPLIYEVPQDADWHDPSLWPLANPALGHLFSMETLTEKYTSILPRPAEHNKFRRLYLNQWTEASEVWIPPVEWDACGVPRSEWPALDYAPCYAGLDLSYSRDLTAFAVTWKKDSRVFTRPYFFVPGEDIEARSRRDNVRYDVWAKQGWVELIPGPVVDLNWAVPRILAICREHDIRCVYFDRHGADPVIQALQNEGIDVIKVAQGALSLNPPAQHLESLVYGRSIVHDCNPVMRWNFSCCTKKEDDNDNMRPIKSKGASSNQRIDGVLGLVMSLIPTMGEETQEVGFWTV